MIRGRDMKWERSAGRFFESIERAQGRGHQMLRRAWRNRFALDRFNRLPENVVGRFVFGPVCQLLVHLDLFCEVIAACTWERSYWQSLSSSRKR